MLKDWMDLFGEKFRNTKHLQKLHGRQLNVTFRTDQSEYHYSFPEAKRLIEKEDIERLECGQVYISGNETVLSELIFGETRLVHLIKHQAVEVEATYKNVLFLDSLFYLTRPDKVS